MLEAQELRQIIDAASKPLRAMVLLGINAGLGNMDCATLPQTAINYGWLNFPRPKTGIARRCPLWPETAAAIEAALATRPKAADKDDAGLVFITTYGSRWVRDSGASRRDNVSDQFAQLLDRLGLHRPRTGFYTLRHTFRTVADAARDPVAIDLIMGHTDPSMAGHYRERIDDSRLQAVAAHVRAWLFGEVPTDDAAGRAGDRDDGEPGGRPTGNEGGNRPVLRLFA
jgi:integrase